VVILFMKVARAGLPRGHLVHSNENEKNIVIFIIIYLFLIMHNKQMLHGTSQSNCNNKEQYSMHFKESTAVLASSKHDK